MLLFGDGFLFVVDYFVSVVFLVNIGYVKIGIDYYFFDVFGFYIQVQFILRVCLWLVFSQFYIIQWFVAMYDMQWYEYLFVCVIGKYYFYFYRYRYNVYLVQYSYGGMFIDFYVFNVVVYGMCGVNLIFVVLVQFYYGLFFYDMDEVIGVGVFEFLGIKVVEYVLIEGIFFDDVFELFQENSVFDIRSYVVSGISIKVV